MIKPSAIPQYTGDFVELAKAVDGLRTKAAGIRSSGQDAHSRFQAMAAYYVAPEDEQLFASTQPVMDTADDFAGDIESLADALDAFITEAKPHADRLKELQQSAFDFVDSVEGEDDWTEDQDKVDKHQALMDGVAAAREGFQEAERNAANKINAISPALCRPVWVVDDGTHQPGMYGQDADSLKSVDDLPWGESGRAYLRALEPWLVGPRSQELGVGRPGQGQHLGRDRRSGYSSRLPRRASARRSLGQHAAYVRGRLRLRHGAHRAGRRAVRLAAGQQGVREGIRQAVHRV
ncbi:hypothetical protein [Streptomyces sp. NPDC007100]|uniref:hypothetical protein n=1 Tax=Streptomyces sp. NPDC007100 TaxID=3155602 RepID=UPI0033E76E66